MLSSGGDSMDEEASIHVEENGKEKYETFNIEQGSGREINDVDGVSVHSHKPLPQSLNPISVADVLKTLFFILVWYTCSLFLTL